jgi:bifunctional DNA-binding transcriptional regulator/antitoxin component of YhaV-PrlF toxin-antitoxin module
LGIRPGDKLEIKRRGDKIEIDIVVDPEFERAQLAELARRLHELGPVVGGDPEDGRIEFPDRPGLY